MFRRVTLIQALIIAFLLITCKKTEEPIVIGTTVITQITISSAQSGGYIASGKASKYGVCWAIHSNPEITDSLTIDGSGAGNYVSKMKHLAPGQQYYVRAYGTDGKGTSYGNEYSFTTTGQAPVCTTTAATYVTSATAEMNGIVNCNYLWTTVTFEYGPDINYGITVTAHQSPLTGSVETNVSAQTHDLNVNTIYHFRMIAENSLGKVYGEDMAFKTFPPTGTKDIVTDIDGNVYETIVMNSQIWMTENLKVEHLNDGTAIPYVTDPYVWEASVNPCYSWHDNNPANKDAGAVYNWYTVGTGKICPAGWHVPDAQEWTQVKPVGLFDIFVGYNSGWENCGGTSCDCWWGTNLYGGAWISACAAYISYDSGSLITYSNYRQRDYHIRCLKDEYKSDSK